MANEDFHPRLLRKRFIGKEESRRVATSAPVAKDSPQQAEGLIGLHGGLGFSKEKFFCSGIGYFCWSLVTFVGSDFRANYFFHWSFLALWLSF